MGTRSLTAFIEEWEYEGESEKDEIAVMYRQMDGYPEGHGKDLAEFLAGGRIVNGIGLAEENEKIFNGMGCLAAQVVAHFKNGPGGIYLTMDSTQNHGQVYTYKVSGQPGQEPVMQIIDVYCEKEDTILFTGTASEALGFIKEYKDNKK